MLALARPREQHPDAILCGQAAVQHAVHRLGDRHGNALLLRKMVTAHYLGRKSGSGFYLYENGKKLAVNPVLTREHRLFEGE